MAECRHCGASLRSPYRFCPMCATPQTEEARTRFREYVERRAGSLGGGDEALTYRLRYAAGYVAIVAGLATLFDVGGFFFLLAGLAVLPPVQRLLEAQLDRPLGPRPTLGAAAGLVVLGALVLVFV